MKYIYSKISDLIFHSLAYINVSNASNLYSEEYKKHITYHSQISENMHGLEKYYNDNFERLGIINFLPSYVHDFTSLKYALLGFDRFTKEDIDKFVEPFTDVLENEHQQYFEFWDCTDKNNASNKKAVENYLDCKMHDYSGIFRHFNKDAAVGLSYSLTNNGRGIYSENTFMAIVPFPKFESSYLDCFFQILHEITHQFTDRLLNSNISMDDGTHDLSENVVIQFDYFLVKNLNEVDVNSYFDWLNKMIGNDIISTEEDLLSTFKVPNEIECEIKLLLNNII